MHTWLAHLEDSGLSRWVAQSPTVLGGISGLHIIGFTIVLGSAVLVNLRILGGLLADQPLSAVVRASSRVIAVGVFLSAVTGFLLFTNRATEAASNNVFRLKIALAVVAVAVHAALVSPLGSPERLPATARWRGAASLALWISLAVTACAYILLE